jgi:hypothetical protein
MKARKVAAVLRRMVATGETEWPPACVWWARAHLRRSGLGCRGSDLGAAVARVRLLDILADRIDYVFRTRASELVDLLEEMASE